MLILAKMIGKGEDDDPWRVNLPTYTMIDCNYDARMALVKVPDDALPGGLPAQSIDIPWDTERQADVVKLTAESKATLNDYMRQHYPEKHRAWDAAEVVI